MKSLFTAIIVWLTVVTCQAQQKRNSDLIEGGKAVIELIKVFKTPKQNIAQSLAAVPVPDSCAIKQRGDVCYKNNTGKAILISLQKRNGDVYEANAYTMRIATGKQECLFQMRAGIYKYKIEKDDGATRLVMSEGEMMVEACDNETKVVAE